jgi:hypothetical protein
MGLKRTYGLATLKRSGYVCQCWDTRKIVVHCIGTIQYSVRRLRDEYQL